MKLNLITPSSNSRDVVIPMQLDTSKVAKEGLLSPENPFRGGQVASSSRVKQLVVWVGGHGKRIVLNAFAGALVIGAGVTVGWVARYLSRNPNTAVGHAHLHNEPYGIFNLPQNVSIDPQLRAELHRLGQEFTHYQNLLNSIPDQEAAKLISRKESARFEREMRKAMQGVIDEVNPVRMKLGHEFKPKPDPPTSSKKICSASWFVRCDPKKDEIRGYYPNPGKR